MNLKENYYNNVFSHIYIEEKALSHPNTKKVISKFSNSEIITIKHYKDMFNRKNQNFLMQKYSPKLILAIKESGFFYKGSSFCEDFGNKNFYYTSCMMNCLYNCEYCYLQGMYPSANIVLFVNLEDTFKEIEKLLEKNSVYLCISYDTDLLAFEGIIGFVEKWIDFLKVHKNLKIELRTKSSNFSKIKKIQSVDRMILAWTISPDEIATKYEKGASPFKVRVNNIKQAIDLGWKVRLCFDPIIYIKDYKSTYRHMINYLFKSINREKVQDLSIGVFRVSKEYLKIMRKQNPKSTILSYPFEKDDYGMTYPKELKEELLNFVYENSRKYIDKNKIYL